MPSKAKRQPESIIRFRTDDPDWNEKFPICPWGKTLWGWDVDRQQPVLRQQRCKRWACDHCGPRRVTQLAIRIGQAKPSKMLTLTVDPKLHENPRSAWMNTRRHIPTLIRTIRQKNDACEHVRVLELTKQGWPHYHLLLRTKFIPHALVKARWAELTGATIVDIRKIYANANVFKYVSKYLTKQLYIPFTSRRISASRHFFPKQELPPRDELNVPEWEWRNETIHQTIFYQYPGRQVEGIDRDTVRIL